MLTFCSNGKNVTQFFVETYSNRKGIGHFYIDLKRQPKRMYTSGLHGTRMSVRYWKVYKPALSTQFSLLCYKVNAHVREVGLYGEFRRYTA
jgi:hypothetical protein